MSLNTSVRRSNVAFQTEYKYTDLGATLFVEGVDKFPHKATGIDGPTNEHGYQILFMCLLYPTCNRVCLHFLTIGI